MKKIISLALVAVVIIAAVVMIPKIAHTCDDCEKFFIGAGYDANVLEDFLATEKPIICKECAKKQHAVSLALGKDLDDFKRDLFE